MSNRPNFIDLSDLKEFKMQNRSPKQENKELSKPAPVKVYNKGFLMAMISTLKSSDIVTTVGVLSTIANNQSYLPPTPLQILESAAINPACGDTLLILLFKRNTPCTESAKMIALAPKVFSLAARNKVLYKQCLDVLLKYSAKVKIDGALVKALAEQPEGKECLRKLVMGGGPGKTVEFDEWEKGDVVNVVRERFGHVVLGEMIERLGDVPW